MLNFVLGSSDLDVKWMRFVIDGLGFGESVFYDGWDGLVFEYSINWFF